MKKYIYFMVMLVIGTMLTACTEDWWEDKKYGNELTLEDISVKGNVVFVELPSGKSETLYLDSVKAANTEVTLNDTLSRVWNDIDLLQVSCEGSRNTYRQTKTHKGNLRTYEGVFYTILKFDGHSVPLTFTHDIVGVVNDKKQEIVREPSYRFNPAIEVVDWRQDRVGLYGQASYHLLIEVTDNKIPVGTLDVILKVYAQNNTYVVR
ncbi:MAG: hypothetical protein IJ770_03590 [Alphaproteobacteria bacterium]|nr:hypothetical protein [Alphaproteobacteria bacterium]